MFLLKRRLVAQSAAILAVRGECSPLRFSFPAIHTRPKSQRVIPNPRRNMVIRKISTSSPTCQKMYRPTGKYAVRVTSGNVNQLLDKYDTWLLDCDGVLWNTDHFTKFTGTSKAVERMRALQKSLLFVTNNSLHARSAYLEKFKDLGGFDSNLEDIYGVAYAAAVHLKHVAKIKSKCYLIGTRGMAEELEQAGIEHIGYGPDNQHISVHPEDVFALDYDPEVEAVLVGYDEFFNYCKLTKACSYLLKPGCHYVATNDLERWIQLNETWRQPLTGPLVSAVSSASDREPIVIGKPYHHLLDCITSQTPDIDLSRTIMVGDSLKTDVAFAKNAGIASLLVLSGATREETLQKEEERGGKNVPDYVMDSFTDFGKMV